MLRIAFAASLALGALAIAVLPAEARTMRAPAPACSNLDAMRGLCLGGRARHLAHRALKPAGRYVASSAGRASGRASQGSLSRSRLGLEAGGQLLPHPAGCPGRAFCGCGAAVRVFGRPVRELWLAAAWYRFPRAVPGAGMVAVRRHHVFVLEAQLDGDVWQVYDANSGRRATRRHARSIRGYAIVNPLAARAEVSP